MSDPSSFSTADARRSPVHYARAIRQHIVLVGLIVGLALAAALVLVATAQKQYEATADIAVTPLPAGDDVFTGFSVFQQALDGSSPVVTAARVFESAGTRARAKAAMGADGKSVTVTITPLSQANVIAVTATAPSAGQAARAANAFAASIVSTRTAIFRKELAAHIADVKRQIAAIPPALRANNFELSTLQQRLATLSSFRNFRDPTVQVVSLASPPAAPSWPRPLLTYAVALLASLLLGCGLAILLEVFNPKVTREDELLLEQRLPILARIPRIPSDSAAGYLGGQKPFPASAWKGYRVLRAVLATAGPDDGFPRSILVTSPSSGDGKTMTAANLAITLAASELRVVLVDGDLHRPMLSTMFGKTPRGEGLSGVLSGQQKVGPTLIGSPYPGLALLLSHYEPTVRPNLTSERRIATLIEELKELADVVVFDSPPLPEVAETLEMATAVDTVLLCVRLGNTRRDKLVQLREMLATRGIAPAGFVLTTSRLRSSAADSYESAYSGADLAAESMNGTPAPAPRAETEPEAGRSRVRPWGAPNS
jgi:capsular exopolysaccharide synthesis family protein